jgi:mannose-6-phosphate isomerase-like protein (cupin superfamily)
MTTGRLTIRSAAGDTAAELTAGAPYYRDAGAEHDVVNPGAGEFVFVEIELKGS